MVGPRTLIDPQLFFHEQMDHLESVESKQRNFQRLYGRHSHAFNEQPFFGILGDDLETLIWSGGGHVLAPLLCLDNVRQNPITTFSDLFSRLGIDDGLRQEIQDDMAKLADGAAMSFVTRLTAKDGNTFGIVFAHRGNEPHGAIQFTLNDLSHFIETERAVRSMASEILAKMGQASDGGRSDIERIHEIQTGVGKLLLLANDSDVAVLASTLIQEVEALAFRTIEILRGFEEAEPDSAKIAVPPSIPQGLSTALPGHIQSFGDWSSLMKRVEAITTGQECLSEYEAHHLYFADSFIRNALPVMIYTSPEGIIYVLNGEKRGEVYDDVDVMVRAIGVDEISRRSASDFFSSQVSGSTTLSINNENAEVRGQVTQGGGWQVMILPAMTQSIDVRGIFHAFKNLLLNLQVLHVVKSRDDVKAVGPALMDTLASIKERIENLRYLAKHGFANQRRSVETVEMWAKAASRASGNQPGEISITGLAETGHLGFRVIHGEMEDSLSEIVRNAFTHGAANLCVDFSKDDQRLTISVSDDGNGLTDEKLQQIRTVIETRKHDASLTTRSDGSGHGLLGVANALSHFIGGRLEIGHNQSGKGSQVRLGMNLPKQYS
ncbi:MAG: ATP-binding protein [Rhodospirillales bacterium]|nr:ATP-binding protein [Rhodospirillales bacterium]